MRRACTAVLLAAALVQAPFAAAAPPPASAQLRHALHRAGVVLEDAGCSGVLAESRQIVVTARHCVKAFAQSLRLRFANGSARTGWVVGLDDRSDQAVLFLEDPVPLAPLRIARGRPVPGAVLFFEGNPRRPRFQQVRLDRIGRCPSLPALPNALYTSIRGMPGDSGAPVVDGGGRIVGLVHGGSRCHIATPAETLLRLLDRVLERDVTAVRGLRAPVRDAEPAHACHEVVAGEAQASRRGFERRPAVEAVADEGDLDALQDAVERHLAVEGQPEAAVAGARGGQRTYARSRGAEPRGGAVADATDQRDDLPVLH